MNAVSLIEDIIIVYSEIIIALAFSLLSVCWDTTDVDEREAGEWEGLTYFGNKFKTYKKIKFTSVQKF